MSKLTINLRIKINIYKLKDCFKENYKIFLILIYFNRKKGRKLKDMLL